MANLAIKGHATRSKEVIEILEMLGGTNSESCWGVFENRLYTINAFGVIEDKSSRDNSNYQVYTLEEFLERFPYKVGDKVTIKERDKVVTITDMSWRNGREIIYETIHNGDCYECFSAEELQPYKEQETMEVPTINLAPEQLGGAQVIIPIPKGYEFVGIDDDKQQAIFERIKPKYPKTHNECCDVLGLPYMQLGVVGYKCETLLYLQKLLLYRHAYWKLAEWNSKIKGERFYMNSLPSFLRDLFPMPTEEMRDAFDENFKDLIEKCKDLV